MRLALYQGPSPGGDIDAAFATIERVAATASMADADMAVLPELFLPGYNAGQMRADADWPDRIAELAARHGVALTIGLAEQDERLGLVNTARAFGPAGEKLARYVKRQLYGPREAALFSPGDDLTLFDYRGRRFALLICYDVEFPELVRACANADAEVILVPTANMMPFDGVSRYAVPSRALENALSIAYANYCGSEGDLTYCGNSVITGPDGEPLAQAGRGPGMLIVDLPDPDAPQLRPLSTQRTDLRPL